MVKRSIKVWLNKENTPNWLHDNNEHLFIITEEKFGSYIQIIKKPGPKFDITYEPWFGPRIVFRNVDCGNIEFEYSPKTDLWINWEDGKYYVLFDGKIVAEKKDRNLAKADSLGLPYDVFSNLDPKTKYKIKKPPEECDSIIPANYRRYIIDKYNLSPDDDSLSEFKYSSTSSQNDRELFHCARYASLISNFFEDEPNISRRVAMLIPKKDRGVDVYLRIIKDDPKNPKIGLIPIQVTEVMFSFNGEIHPNIPLDEDDSRVKIALEEPYGEQRIVDMVRSAKLKDKPNEDEILLCALLPISSGELDYMKLRELFENYEWPYEKIVCVDAFHGAVTVYCKEPHVHYFIHNDEGISVGRTFEEIKKNSEKKGEITIFHIKEWPE